MGSPSFYTNTNLLNVAIEAACDFDECVGDTHKNMKYFIENELPQLFFHKIEMNSAYGITGFQVYIDSQWCNFDKYVASIVEDWQCYQEFSDLDGYCIDLQDCPYFNKNIKNVTAFSLKQAIKREHKTLHNLLLAKAQELEMGEVVGKSWTSSVTYPIQSQFIS